MTAAEWDRECRRLAKTVTLGRRIGQAEGAQRFSGVPAEWELTQQVELPADARPDAVVKW